MSVLTVLLLPMENFRLQLPPAATVVLPSWVVPLRIATVVLASPVPLTVKLLPVLAARPASKGVLGGTVSVVTASLPETALTLPATSVAVAEMLCAPSPSFELTTLQVPVPEVVALPTNVLPS